MDDIKAVKMISYDFFGLSLKIYYRFYLHSDPVLLYCPCLCCHSICYSMWSFWVEANLCRFCLYVLLFEIQLSRGEGWDLIYQFNHATFFRVFPLFFFRRPT